MLTDYLNGYVSRQGAHDDYGVVIDDRDQLDLNATETLRSEMRARANVAEATAAGAKTSATRSG
jgi:hypothetical protein